MKECCVNMDRSITLEYLREKLKRKKIVCPLFKKAKQSNPDYTG